MELLLALEALAVSAFVVIQISGPLRLGGRLLARIGLLDVGPNLLEGVDAALTRFYRTQWLRLTLSIACHFVGWGLSALETYVILHALGRPVSAATAIVIEAFGTGVRFASFMIPGHLGVLEGGHVAIFAALGLPGSLGLGFSLVRRVREAVWTAVGLAALTAVGGRAATREAALVPRA
jgi:uncharacterized protein (TIRG00374 family)